MGNPHAEVEIKPQLKPRGSVAKDEDPKPSHQLYKRQVKSTRSTGRTLCLWKIRKATERSHRENALVLVAVDIGGKNRQGQNQIGI